MADRAALATSEAGRGEEGGPMVFRLYMDARDNGWEERWIEGR
jgi:hypothetical protein